MIAWALSYAVVATSVPSSHTVHTAINWGLAALYPICTLLVYKLKGAPRPALSAIRNNV